MQICLRLAVSTATNLALAVGMCYNGFVPYAVPFAENVR